MRWKEESLHIQVLRKLKIMGQPAHQDGAQLTQYAAGQAALGHYANCKYYQILAKCIQNAAEPHSMGPNPVMRSPPPAMRKPRENGEPMGLQGGLHERRAQSPGDEADVAADQTGAAQANSSSSLLPLMSCQVVRKTTSLWQGA